MDALGSLPFSLTSSYDLSNIKVFTVQGPSDPNESISTNVGNFKFAYLYIHSSFSDASIQTPFVISPQASGSLVGYGSSTQRTQFGSFSSTSTSITISQPSKHAIESVTMFVFPA